MQLIRDSEWTRSYWILRPLGRGAHGEVFDCVRIDDGARFAAKLVKGSENGNPRKGWANEYAKSELFAPGSPGYSFAVVAVTDAFIDTDGRHWLVQERCDGCVADLFEDDPTYFGDVWMVPVARGVLWALEEVHLAGRAHTDVHSGNVFFRVGPNPNAFAFKLGDFSLAAQWWDGKKRQQDLTLVLKDIRDTAMLLCEVALGRLLGAAPQLEELGRLPEHWSRALWAGLNGDFKGEGAATYFRQALGIPASRP